MYAKFSFPFISIENLNGPKGLCDVVKASQVFFYYYYYHICYFGKK